MENKDTTSIEVMVAGRSYPLIIKKTDEEIVKNIVKDINTKINQFKINYQKQDIQDWLTMTLLTNAMELTKLQSDESNTAFDERIDRIHQLIDTTLN
jgi:cell division protein ZapA (FtsZ GTPase activity inhibitor)